MKKELDKLSKTLWHFGAIMLRLSPMYMGFQIAICYWDPRTSGSSLFLVGGAVMCGMSIILVVVHLNDDLAMTPIGYPMPRNGEVLDLRRLSANGAKNGKPHGQPALARTPLYFLRVLFSSV